MCSRGFTVREIRVREKQSDWGSFSSHHLSVLVLNVNPHLFSEERTPPSPSMASCAPWTHMMCQRWLCLRMPVPVRTLSDYYTNSLITRGPLLLLRFKHLFYSVFPQFFFLGGWGFFSYFAPMHIPPLSVPSRPHLCLLQPLFPPTLHIPGVSGWKVQWGCRIPEGQRGLCLIPTRALYVCKSRPTDRPVGSFGG